MDEWKSIRQGVLVNGRSTRARLVLRPKIVLAAADVRENKDIALNLGCKRETVGN